MNWTRICRYTLLVVLATFLAGFVPGFMRGVYQTHNALPPAWVDALQSLLLPAAVLIVFLFLARAQSERTISHAMAVWALTTVVSTGNMALGVTPAEWAGAATYSAILAAIGTAIGMKLAGSGTDASRARAGERVT